METWGEDPDRLVVSLSPVERISVSAFLHQPHSFLFFFFFAFSDFEKCTLNLLGFSMEGVLSCDIH